MQRNSIANIARERNMSKNSKAEENEPSQFCFSDAGLATLARACKGLERLSLIWCSAITSSGLVTIAENCRNLKCLDLQVFSLFSHGFIVDPQLLHKLPMFPL